MRTSALLSLILCLPPWRLMTMAFQRPTNMKAIGHYSRQQHVKRTNSVTFFMEVRSTNTSQNIFPPQRSKERNHPKQRLLLPKSMTNLSTQRLSMVSTFLAACSTIIHASLLSRLDHVLTFPVVMDSIQFSPQPISFLSSATTVGGEGVDSLSEFFSDMSHLALDVLTILCAPSMMTARLASVAGRLFALTADYLPDHALAPEEWFFQVLMLYLSFSGLYKATFHALFSNIVAHPLDHQDMRAYSMFFKSAGMRWDQYRALLVFAMDWITIPEGCSISSNQDYAYILYKGRVVVGKNASTTTATTVESKAVIQKLGAIGFLQRLDTRNNNGIMHSSSAFLDIFRKASHDDDDDDDECFVESLEDEISDETWTSVQGSVTLLRINTRAAMSLIRDYDETLELPLRNIMLRGIKAKLQHVTSCS